MRSTTDGIKAMSRDFLGGKQVEKVANGRNDGFVFVYSRQQEIKTFSIMSKYG